MFIDKSGLNRLVWSRTIKLEDPLYYQKGRCHEFLLFFQQFFCLSISELDDDLDVYNKKQKELQNKMEYWKAQERESTEKIDAESKELEKMTNKQSLLLKKVGGMSLFFYIWSL